MSVKYYLFQCRKTLFILRSVVIYFPRRKCINKYKYKHIYCENYVSILCPPIAHISYQNAAHTYNNKITHCQYFHLVTLTSRLCITNHQLFSVMTKHILLYLNIGMQNYYIPCNNIHIRITNLVHPHLAIKFYGTCTIRYTLLLQTVYIHNFSSYELCACTRVLCCTELFRPRGQYT